MFIPTSCVDVLYNYIPILEKERLCQLPKESLGKKVAVIGGGAAGIVVAHELLKLGLKPVIYEASDRLGGRLYSKPFTSLNPDQMIHAELGAMRIPYSSSIFLHYIKKLGIENKKDFPAPGVVDTMIYYKNLVYNWKAGTLPPTPFREIRKLWERFINPIIFQLNEAWSKGDIDDVIGIWQLHINQFANKSFYEVLSERSPFNPDYLNIFGALGMGAGGFGPLYQVGFLEILRMIINGYLGKQILFSNGVSEFIDKLYELKINTPDGKYSLKDKCELHLNTPIVQMDYNLKTGNPIVISKFKNELEKAEYQAAVFTGSCFAAQLINLTSKTNSDVYLLDENVRASIRNSFLMASSKTFICTEKKFWKNSSFPQCLLTDEVMRAIYFLDYPKTDHGVVCLSYTWGVDALKLHAIDPLDRLVIFKRILKEISPEINGFIQPINNEVLNIDWMNIKYQNGAFNIFNPGNDTFQKNLYYQFKSCLKKETDRGLYLAGDGVSWSGGWVEGAMYTALNAVFSVAKRFGANLPSGSPLDQNENLYNYT